MLNIQLQVVANITDQEKHNKVITITTVIWTLDDPHCARAAIAHWDLGESCAIAHGVTSKEANVLSNVPCCHFQRSSAVRLQF